MHKIILQNHRLSLTVLPELGGKISSLFDKENERECFWLNPHLPMAAPEYGDSYIEKLDSGGWDEIFPAVEPCTLVEKFTIPDHGDLVQLPWEVISQDEGSVTMRVITRAYPTSFERRISLDDNVVKMEYTLSIFF